MGIPGTNIQIGLLREKHIMETVQSMNSETIQSILNDPMVAQIIQHNPEYTNVVNGLNMMWHMATPEAFRASINLLQGMYNTTSEAYSFSGMGMPQETIPPFNSMPAPQAAAPPSHPNPLEFTSRMKGNRGFEGAEFPAAAAAPEANLSVEYAPQLAQMREMGFENEGANLRLLKEANGDVQAAVAKLL
eukprot:TRINITY_DN10857_c0_g7_i1.p1 TRINITY_DN10857_c0_g7~~TRINITY_DN10857_c0_g7_i1.p1  ORF type:complete len:189 (-),score=11.62 TRINITY_DN10857_c0_g7_i1:137-703(-)